MEWLLLVGVGYLLLKNYQSKQPGVYPEPTEMPVPDAGGPIVEGGPSLIVGEEQIPQPEFTSPPEPVTPVIVDLGKPVTVGDVAIQDVVTSDPGAINVPGPDSPSAGFIYFNSDQAFLDALASAGFDMRALIDDYNALIDQWQPLANEVARVGGWKVPNQWPKISSVKLINREARYLAELGVWKITYSTGSVLTRTGVFFTRDIMPRLELEIANMSTQLQMG